MTYFINVAEPTVLLMKNNLLGLPETWVSGDNLPPALVEDGYRSVESPNEAPAFEVNDDGTVTRWALGDPKLVDNKWVMEYESYTEEWHDPLNDEIIGTLPKVEE